MLLLASHGANLFNLCPFPDSSALYVQNWFPIRPAVWPQFPSILNCWSHETTHNAALVYRGANCLSLCPFPDESTHVYQIWCQSVQPNWQLPKPFECVTPYPHPPDMPPGVLRHTCQPREKFSRDKRRPVEWSEAGFGRGVWGSSPWNLQKPVLQMVQSELFLSYICQHN